MDEDGGEGRPRHSLRIQARSALAMDPADILADFVSLATISTDAQLSSDIISLSLQEPTILDIFFMDPPMALMTTNHDCAWDLKKPPNSYAEACACPDVAAWRAAMDREISSLRDMGAFLECDLPPGKKPLTLKWVYDYKTDSDGQIIAGKEKARVVARGFRQ